MPRKYITFATLSLLSVIGLLLMVLAPQIGLGLDEDFILYKLFSLNSMQTVKILLLVLFVGLLPFITPIGLSLLDHTKIPPYVYALFIFVVAVVSFFVDPTNHNAFEWTTTQDIPAILRLLDPSFIPQDNYTNAVIKSARWFTWHTVIAMMNIFRLDWYGGLYLLKVLIGCLAPVLYFLVAEKTLAFWYEKEGSPKYYEVIKFMAVMIILLIDFDEIKIGYLGGWSPIQNFNTVSPMGLSFMMGLLYNYFYFSKTSWSLLRIPFLVLATLYHPPIALCHWVVSGIFSLPKAHSRKDIINYIVDLIVGIIPAALFLTTGSVSAITRDQYFLIYLPRHAHHYLVSYFFRPLRSVLFVTIMAIPVFISMLTRKKSYIIMALLAFISIPLAVLVQFLGVEVLYSRFLLDVGPSRFSAFFSILWTLSLLIGLCGLSRSVIPKCLSLLKKESPFTFITQMGHSLCQNLVKIQNNSFIKRPMFGVVLVMGIILILTWRITLKDPLNRNMDNHEIIQLISELTPHDATIAIVSAPIDSYLIRVYAQRPVIQANSRSYPFYQGPELITYLRANRTLDDAVTQNQISCLPQKLGVNYLLAAGDYQLDATAKIVQTSKFVLYDLTKLPPVPSATDTCENLGKNWFILPDYEERTKKYLGHLLPSE